MNQIYDVLVIGAGPGGLMTARECSSFGFSTVVIEKKKGVGVPVHCGECISNYALINTGLTPPDDVIANSVKGVSVRFPDGNCKKLIESGHILNKDKFQQWLARSAEKNGTELLLNTRVTGFVRKEERWEIELENHEPLKSRFLVDASGVQSIINKNLKLSTPFQTKIGIQYEMEGLDCSDYIEFFIDPQIIPNGYLWIIPKEGTTCKVGLVTQRPNQVKSLLTRFIDQHKKRPADIKKKSGGFIPASGPLNKTYDHRLLIVGDAAGFTNPLFEGGTHLALKSGSLAGQFINQAFQKNDFSSRFLSGYQRSWKRLFPDYTMIMKGKEIFYDFSPEIINSLGTFVPHELRDFPFSRKLLTAFKVFLTDPSLLFNGSYYAMKAFEYSKAQYYGW